MLYHVQPNIVVYSYFLYRNKQTSAKTKTRWAFETCSLRKLLRRCWPSEVYRMMCWMCIEWCVGCARNCCLASKSSSTFPINSSQWPFIRISAHASPFSAWRTPPPRKTYMSRSYWGHVFETSVWMCCTLLIKQGKQLSCTVILKLTTFVWDHIPYPPQIRTPNKTNHMQVLIEQCNLSSRTNQSRTSTSINPFLVNFNRPTCRTQEIVSLPFHSILVGFCVPGL